MAGGHDPHSKTALAEINVTPLVDVMLVLLIIFMVASPMLTRGIEVGLPQAVSGEKTEEPRVTVTIDRSGQFFVDRRPVSDALLVQEVKRCAGGRADHAVYLEGDTAVSYGRVMAAMDALRVAGMSRVALITAPPPVPPHPHAKR